MSREWRGTAGKSNMINSTSKTETTLRTDFVPEKSPRVANGAARQTDTDRLSASSQETLQNVLSQQPEVRTDMVERGKALLVDANYPPKEIIRQLTELLVNTADLSE